MKLNFLILTLIAGVFLSACDPVKEASYPQFKGAFIDCELNKAVLSESGKYVLTLEQLDNNSHQYYFTINPYGTEEEWIMVSDIFFPANKLPKIMWDSEDRVWCYEETKGLYMWHLQNGTWHMRKVDLEEMSIPTKILKSIRK